MTRTNPVQLSLMQQANDLCDPDGTPNARRIRKIVFPKMSAEDFAHLLGVSASTYRSWEYNKRQPSGAALSLLKMAAAAPELVQDILGVSGAANSALVAGARNRVEYMAA